MTESIVSFSFPVMSGIHPADSPLAYFAPWHFEANSADGWTLSGQLEVVGGASEQDTTEIRVVCEFFLSFAFDYKNLDNL